MVLQGSTVTLRFDVGGTLVMKLNRETGELVLMTAAESPTFPAHSMCLHRIWQLSDA